MSKDSDILCKKSTTYTIRTLTLKCGKGYPIEHLHATYRRDLRVKMKNPVNPSRIAKITGKIHFDLPALDQHGIIPSDQ